MAQAKNNRKTIDIPVGKERTLEVINALEMQGAENLDEDLQGAIEQCEEISGSFVGIHRIGVHGRDLTFIDEVPPANFSKKMLKHPPYNGGAFRVFFHGERGKLIRNFIIKVEPPPKAEPSPYAPPLAVQPVVNNDALAQAMLVGFGRIGDAMARLGELIVSQRALPAAPQQSMRELLSDVSALRELIAPQGADPLKLLESVLGIAKEIAPGGGGGEGRTEMDVLYKLTEEFLPKIMQASEQPAVRRIGPFAAPILQQPRPVASTPQVPPSNGGESEVITKQRMALGFLIQQAKNGNDPEPYAVMVLDNVSPVIVDQYANDADWFEKLTAIAPGVAPHRAWFERLRAHIVEYLTNNEERGHTAGVKGATPPDAPASPGS